MAEEGYNRRNRAVKRILQEVKEMESNPSDDFTSLPLEEDIFEWQFAIRGPQDTEFQGGIYHGRIQLPAEYPFKPPSFVLLTPNGRFETQKKICLSISNFHPEHWQPSWSVRTALVALVAFMPSNPDGALGSLDYPKEVRRELAIKSREAAPKYGSPDRQKIIDEIHRYMLSKVPIIPQIQPSSTVAEHANNNPEEVIALSDSVAAAEDHPDQVLEDRDEDLHEVHIDAAAGPLRIRLSAGISLHRMRPDKLGEQSQRPQSGDQNSRDDKLLTWAAVGLTLAILFLLAKKFLKSNMLAGYTDNL